MTWADSSHVVFFFKQKTAYEMRISDWSSDVCSSDLIKPCRIYGMTELPTVSMPCPADSARQRLETDGRIAPGVDCEAVDPDTRLSVGLGVERSEERRVGKECVSTCRSRGTPDHYKNKQIGNRGWGNTKKTIRH